LSDAQKAEIAKIKADYDMANAELKKHIDRLEAERSGVATQLADTLAELKYAKQIAEMNSAAESKSKLRKRMLSVADKLEADYHEYMKQAGSRLTSGVDPARLVALAKLGAAYIIRGTVSFAEWTTKIRGVASDLTAEQVDEVYEKSREMAQRARLEASVEESQESKKKQRDEMDNIQTVKELFREQAEAGVKTLAEAIENVHAIVSKERDVTPEQVRDEFSDYGKMRKLSRDEVDVVLADLRRQAQLDASMDRVAEGLPPLKSGAQRDKPSQTVREMTRTLRQMMRRAGMLESRSQEQIAGALSAIKTRLLNEIEDIEKAINSHVRMADKKMDQIEYDEEAKALRARRDALYERYEEIFPPTPISDEQRLKIAIKAAERSLAQADKKLKDARSGVFQENVPKELPYSERLAALRAARDSANAETEALYELAFPNKKAIEAKKKRTLAAIAEMERRIREQDFEVRELKPVDISGDKEAMAAQAQLAEARLKFAEAKEQARRAARTPEEATKEFFAAIPEMQRDILASYDLSAVGRQGWYAVLSHPLLAMKATGAMLRAIKQGSSAQIAEALRERKNYPLYLKAGLALAADDGTGNFTHVEDRFRLKLVEKIPGINLSNRAYATFLNVLRADIFDSLLAGTANPADVSEAKIKALAEGINILTGRGDLGKFGNRRIDPHTMSRFLWAPRFFKAAFDILTVKPLRTGTKESRFIFGKEYLRAAGAMALIYMIASLFRDKDDDKVQWDPRSSDFGAIPVPGTSYKVNPFGFVRPMLVFASRMASGVSVSTSGKRKLRETITFADKDAEKPSYGGGMASTIGRFLRSKAHPNIGFLLSLFIGEDYSGKKITPLGLAKDAVTPLALRDAYQAFSLEDPDAAAVFSLLMLLGVEVKPDYQSPEWLKYDSENDEEYKKTIGKLLKNATDPKASDYDRARAIHGVKGMSSEKRAEILTEHIWATKRGKTIDKQALRDRLRRLSAMSPE
jgi:hypothetical protein